MVRSFFFALFVFQNFLFRFPPIKLVQPFYYPPSVDEAEMTSPIFTFTTRDAKPRDPPICFV